MAFVPFENTIKAEMIYTWNAERCENVLYYQFEEAVTEAALLDLADALRSIEDTNLKIHRTSAAQLELIRTTDMTVDNGIGVDIPIVPPIAGTVAGGSAPNNVSWAIKKNSPRRGRSYRGRIYHIGMPLAGFSGSLVGSTFRSETLEDYENLLSVVGTLGVYDMIIASRIADGVERAVGEKTIVTSLSADDVLDSQRRRLPGRGE